MGNTELITKTTENLPKIITNQVSRCGSWKTTSPAVGFAPKFCAECNGRELSIALTATLLMKNQKFDPGPKNVDITKLFAPKFCAECTGRRELHSSHGDPFRELFDLPANKKKCNIPADGPKGRPQATCIKKKNEHVALDPAPAPLS